MKSYSIEPRTRNYVEGNGLLSFARTYSTNTGRNHWILLQKTEIDVAKTAPKKVFYKTSAATGELIENKVTKKVVEPKSAPEANTRNMEEIISPPEKRKKY